jgi:hypothetical protein
VASRRYFLVRAKASTIGTASGIAFATFNLKTAKALGLAITRDFLLIVDEVIE